jgi:signal transduction histidine kinase
MNAHWGGRGRPATYRSLVYLLSAMPLGLVWFVAIVVVWSLCLGLAITPVGIPLAIGMAFMTRGFAAVEAELAGSLLGVEAHAPAIPGSQGRFWARVRALFRGDFWRAQLFLLSRFFIGFPVAVLVISLLVTAFGMIFAPLWVPFVHGGAQLGFWRPHTFLQSLAFVPLGIVLLPLTLWLVSWLGVAAASLASLLLSRQSVMPGTFDSTSQPARRIPPRRALQINATVSGMIVFVLVLIWAITSGGPFWPIWVVLPLALVLAIQGWFVVLAERPALTARFGHSRVVAGTVGVGAAVVVYLIAIWAITGHGYFWPVWPMLGIAVVVALEIAGLALSTPDRSELTERIETLETTRAGAVDVQDSELRRIERDLHDGAQARLVALGMSLGMAEQKLADEPERAGELLAEARAGAEEALRELRSLARGIHPPVLADRGLEAAIRSLVSSSPMRVSLTVELTERLPPAVESAAYFVVAEALANATKHSGAERVWIEIDRHRETLELSVHDDGAGGANPNGSGLVGLRRRVEALDGSLTVTSPPGGPTTISARLPCGS